MKQKKQNRILAALLAVVMMFQMLPMMAFADEGAGSEGAPSDVTLRSRPDTMKPSATQCKKILGNTRLFTVSNPIWYYAS